MQRFSTDTSDPINNPCSFKPNLSTEVQKLTVKTKTDLEDIRRHVEGTNDPNSLLRHISHFLSADSLCYVDIGSNTNVQQQIIAHVQCDTKWALGSIGSIPSLLPIKTQYCLHGTYQSANFKEFL